MDRENRFMPSEVEIGQEQAELETYAEKLTQEADAEATSLIEQIRKTMGKGREKLSKILVDMTRSTKRNLGIALSVMAIGGCEGVSQVEIKTAMDEYGDDCHGEIVPAYFEAFNKREIEDSLEALRGMGCIVGSPRQEQLAPFDTQSPSGRINRYVVEVQMRDRG